MEWNGIVGHLTGERTKMPEQDNKYTLTTKWSTKEPFTKAYAINKTVEKVRKDAGDAFEIDPAKLQEYKVLWDKGNNIHVPLPIDSKLKDIDGLGDGACLLLQGPTTPMG